MSKKLCVYLACPYSHPDPVIRELRFKEANKASIWLMAYSHDFFNPRPMVISPISMGNPIVSAGCSIPYDFKVWQDLNYQLLDCADILVILAIKGFKESQGVQAEIKYAQEKGKKTYMLYPPPYLSSYQLDINPDLSFFEDIEEAKNA